MGRTVILGRRATPCTRVLHIPSHPLSPPLTPFHTLSLIYVFTSCFFPSNDNRAIFQASRLPSGGFQGGGIDVTGLVFVVYVYHSLERNKTTAGWRTRISTRARSGGTRSGKGQWWWWDAMIESVSFCFVSV